MPGVSQVVFCAIHLDRTKVEGRRILDVGACDYNGSVRPLLESWSPREYIGVDIHAGPRVDRVCSADNLVEEFGAESFDLVLCIEMLEHAPNWRRALDNMKQILKPGGLLLLTTRSLGYPCHGFPNDYWRYQVEDMSRIFADFEIQTIAADPAEPGVFVLAQKPGQWQAADLSSIELYCVLTGRRESAVPQALDSSSYYRRLALKQRVRALAAAGFLGAGRLLTRTLRLESRP